MAPIMSVTDLTKKFDEITAVDHISFSVERGEIFAFLGPNGAGKTTTIKMLTTILHPTSGSMMLDGHDPTTEQHLARRSFGIVFQDPSLDDELTAEENLELHAALYSVPRALRKERIPELLRFVGLWERRNDYVSHFSGGMKRRLEIARGLIHHPRILFLDEPTIGLDPQTRNHLWEYLQTMNRTEGTSIFFTTHYMEEAQRVAHRIAIIDHGHIVAIGTPKELLQRTGGANLEEAFLALTGHAIREESASAIESLRMHRRMWRR